MLLKMFHAPAIPYYLTNLTFVLFYSFNIYLNFSKSNKYRTYNQWGRQYSPVLLPIERFALYPDIDVLWQYVMCVDIPYRRHEISHLPRRVTVDTEAKRIRPSL